MEVWRWLRWMLASALAGWVAAELFACNEATCGPRVSKCMLIKSCNCSMTPDDLKAKNCSCCKDCVKCLGEYFTACCSCVGLCRPAQPLDPRLAMRSFIGDLEPDEEQISLFEMITEADDGKGSGLEWVVHTFPSLDNKFFYKERGPNATVTHELRASIEATYAHLNCTVAYVNDCLPVDKCKTACQSLGASSYRWFLTGCCECVGDDCMKYGSRDAKCANCDELDFLDDNLVSARKAGEL